MIGISCHLHFYEALYPSKIIPLVYPADSEAWFQYCFVITKMMFNCTHKYVKYHYQRRPALGNVLINLFIKCQVSGNELQHLSS